MSKDVPVIGPALTGIGTVFGASPMGQAMKIPSPPPPPPPPKPVEMPDPGDVLKKKRKEADVTASLSGGRSGTILSDSIRDRLGG